MGAVGGLGVADVDGGEGEAGRQDGVGDRPADGPVTGQNRVVYQPGAGRIVVAPARGAKGTFQSPVPR
ncbi:hypothetical protein GCM10010222_09720 [Streptomyces tanashiensis]|nr:hypothetical protein GCM10010222_09720 [Streptomyces tanashiensis]